MYAKQNKGGLPTLMVDDTPDAPCTKSTLHKEQGLDILLYPPDTVKVVLRLKKIVAFGIYIFCR